MQPKIDVLALMDTAAARIRNSENLVHGRLQKSLCKTIALEIYQARDVVSELVDAVDHWCALMPGLAGGPEFDRMLAALNRIEKP